MSNFYTVTEYARLVGKDPASIRRLLIAGKLIGEKFGKQWMISKDTAYPEDGRVKSGNYRNWRRMVEQDKVNPELMKSIKRMSKDLAELYGDELDKIVLYGSYARGEQTAESDVDIAVVLKVTDEKNHEMMIDIVVDYELDLGVTLSVVPIEYGQYMEWKDSLPFYKNIEKEGIVLWKTA